MSLLAMKQGKGVKLAKEDVLDWQILNPKGTKE